MEDALLKAMDMKKHAYLIMAHNEFHMLKKLLTELDDERNDIFLHIDKRTKFVDEAEISSWINKSNIYFAPRMRVCWGHLSIVRCELKLLSEAIKGEYHYYHLLSGVDFPLKSQDEIHEFFEMEDSEFMHYHPDGYNNDYFLYKVKHYYPLLKIVGNENFDGPGKKQRVLRKLVELQWKLQKFQDDHGVDRTRNDKKTVFYKGNQWFSITHDFAQYVVSKAAGILKKYRMTNGPDEIFMPTLAMNSSFAGRVCENYTRIDSFFARKISYDNNPELVEAMINHLHHQKETKKRPLVSIVVPCYNVEKYISCCLDSLVDQSYSNVEIILIDDGSTDRTSELIREYADKYSNVFYHFRENGGLSAARNSGIALAKGEYIAFVDSDDWVEPDYIEKLYRTILRGNADIAICGFKKEDMEEDIVTFDRDELMSSHAAMRILGDIYPKENVLMVIACNKLYKASLFDNLRFPECRIHEDEFCAHRIIGKADVVSVITDPLYHYRIRVGSITANDKMQNLKHMDYLDAFSDRISGVSNMMFGDLLIFMIYTYYEGMKQLMVRYSEETIKKHDLYSFFRRKATSNYLKYYWKMDSYQRKDYLKLIIFPKKYREEVIRHL